MEFNEVIRKRTATRKFSDKKVEENKLNNVLEAGRTAPTAKNIQPIKIYVINSDEGIKKLDEATPCRYGANIVLLVCGDTELAYKKGDYSTYEMDACIVATHLMLAATNEGLDNIWVEMFDENVIRDKYNIPSNLKPICLLPIGYKTDDCPLNPLHNKRKELSEIIERI